MEVKKPSLFVILTFLLIAVMGGIIYLFSHHPMGADFTTYYKIDPESLQSPNPFDGKRIAIRGEAITPENVSLFIIEGRKGIIAYIRKRILKEKPYEKAEYEDFNSNDFILKMDKYFIWVKGQPEQIISEGDRFHSKEDPKVVWDTIRKGKMYSVFGTLVVGPHSAYVKPYLVTSRPIDEIYKEAQEANKKVMFKQYASIFVAVILYILALWKGGVFGRTQKAEEKEEKASK